MESATVDDQSVRLALQSESINTLDKAMFSIEPVRFAVDLEATKSLFVAYVSWLGIDLTFQDFDAEMSAMPGKYAPPRGELFLARNADGDAVGCVGLRPIGREGYCEMKRLYVTPQGRGLGIGKALVDVALETAIHLEYVEMRLDTLPSMVGAISLYKKSGFVEIPPYYETPLTGTVFLARKLRDRVS